MRIASGLLAILAGACGSGAGSSSGGSAAVGSSGSAAGGSGGGSATPAPVVVARPITFGECADASTKFVLGPRPMPRLAPVGNSGEPALPSTAAFRPTGGQPPSSTDKHVAEFGDSDGIGLGGLGPSHHDAFGGGIGPLDGGYGTIGHGNGTGVGQGYGAGRGSLGRRPSVPTVVIQVPTVNGGLDAAIIRRMVRRNISKLQYCYEKQLLVSSDLAGTVTAKFGITTEGKVFNSTASGVDPTVSSCIAQVIGTIEFPKPTSNVTVTYPLQFKRNDDGDSSFRPRVPPAPTVPPKPPEPPRVDGRALFHARSDGDPSSKTYNPGASNPLRTERDALATCFAASKIARAVVLVDLGDAPPGTTGAPAVRVVDPGTDLAFDACIERVAAKVKPLGTATRCSIMFGDVIDSELLEVAITADNVEIGGKALATVASLAPDTAPTKIVELGKLLAETRASAVAKDAPAMVELLPIVVAPVDATTMKTVTIVAATIFAAGDDLVLAGLRPDKPVFVPVPVGTGGMWHPVRMPGPSMPNALEVSVLVRKSDVWIRSTKQPSQIVQLADLEAALAKLRGGEYAARTDLEIAADGDAIYGDLKKAIAAASKVGFVDWQLVSPRDLAQRP